MLTEQTATWFLPELHTEENMFKILKNKSRKRHFQFGWTVLESWFYSIFWYKFGIKKCPHNFIRIESTGFSYNQIALSAKHLCCTRIALVRWWKQMSIVDLEKNLGEWKYLKLQGLHVAAQIKHLFPESSSMQSLCKKDQLLRQEKETALSIYFQFYFHIALIVLSILKTGMC